MNTKVLIVEDSPTQLEQLRYILEKEGYDVSAAKNGLNALEVLKHTKPELIISDIMMPELDGYALCEQVKKNPETKDIPIVLLTNLSDPQDVIRGLQSGADNFLTKPYNETFLLSRIRYILINKEIRQNSLSSDMGMAIVFGGKKYFINSDRMQIIDLLLSTYENAIQKNKELIDVNKQLVSMHNELETKNLQLQKLNEDKNKFLRIAAHDLRNPVGTILSMSSILLDEEGDSLSPQVREMIGVMESSSSFMLQLLNELLDVAVIESGKLNLNIFEIDLVSLITNNILHNKPAADKKSIALEFKSDLEKLDATVDSVKIEQVLNNLISNAVKFSHTGKSITINLKQEEDNAVITVRDQGQGIPEAEMDKLFKPFSKTSVKSTHGEQSTGLGLSIVKKIIEAHNGRIWAESEVNVGSAFSFSIPLKAKEEA